MSERGSHIETCPECGSEAVYHDPGASGEVKQWYDCVGCGSRLMQKWKPADLNTVDDDGQQREDNHNRFSDFEMGTTL